MRWLDVLDDTVEWVAKSYPREGCGLILERGADLRFLPCENLADAYHAADPISHPRTARDFYIVDPMEFVHAEDRGEAVRVIVHSHVDAGDYFSDDDVAAAIMPRFDRDAPLQPTHPGVDYLVVSVRADGPDHASLFRFDAEADRGFRKVWERGL